MSDDSTKPTRKRRKTKAAILGIGIDNDDGHKRITTGDQFLLVGGSKDTHEIMTETMVKTFEELKRRDKRLENVDPRELRDIIDRSRPA